MTVADTAQWAALLEPDRAQIEVFVDALFRHAGTRGFVSVKIVLRRRRRQQALQRQADRANRRFPIRCRRCRGLRAARRPGPETRRVLPTDRHLRQRREREGKGRPCGDPALSVECDQRPQQAREILERLLGPSTVIVRSGGTWADPTGAIHDKIHLHWRLSAPAHGADRLKLKSLREFAARVVHGDPSSGPICHPIRWPGSWHRKGAPRLCAIEAINADREINLDAAFDILSWWKPKLEVSARTARAVSGKRWGRTRQLAKCPWTRRSTTSSPAWIFTSRSRPRRRACLVVGWLTASA